GGEARAGPFGLLPVLALVPPHTVPGRSGAERRGGVPGSGVRRGAAAVRPLGVHGVGGLGGLGTAPHGPVVIVVIGEDRSERSGRRPFGTVVPGLGARLAVGPPAGGVRVLRGGLVPGLLLLSGALGTGAVLIGEDRSEGGRRRPFGGGLRGRVRLAGGPRILGAGLGTALRAVTGGVIVVVGGEDRSERGGRRVLVRRGLGLPPGR